MITPQRTYSEPQLQQLVAHASRIECDLPVQYPLVPVEDTGKRWSQTDVEDILAGAGYEVATIERVFDTYEQAATVATTQPQTRVGRFAHNAIITAVTIASLGGIASTAVHGINSQRQIVERERAMRASLMQIAEGRTRDAANISILYRLNDPKSIRDIDNTQVRIKNDIREQLAHYEMGDVVKDRYGAIDRIREQLSKNLEKKGIQVEQILINSAQK